jgi:hypothetical protein
MRYVTQERLQFQRKTHTRARKRRQNCEWKQSLVVPRIKKQTCNEMGRLPCTRDSVGWQVSVVMPYANHFPETTKQVEKFEGGCL